MSELEDLIGGAFGGRTAPFAIHNNDRIRAASYLAAALEAQLNWSDVEADIRNYLTTQNASKEWIEEQVAKARSMFEPWMM